MKLFKMGENVKLKILIWHMVGEMVKKWSRFYLSCNYSCKLYFLGKILLVKFENLNPIQDGHFCGCSQMEGGGQKGPPCLKSVTHILQ